MRTARAGTGVRQVETRIDGNRPARVVERDDRLDLVGEGAGEELGRERRGFQHVRHACLRHEEALHDASIRCLQITQGDKCRHAVDGQRVPAQRADGDLDIALAGFDAFETVLRFGERFVAGAELGVNLVGRDILLPGLLLQHLDAPRRQTLGCRRHGGLWLLLGLLVVIQ